MKAAESTTTTLKDKIEQVLTEARVVLPGVQALLGFQLSIMLMQGFESLPPSSRYIHLTSLALMTLSIILLISPAAYHRIVEQEKTRRMYIALPAACCYSPRCRCLWESPVIFILWSRRQ